MECVQVFLVKPFRKQAEKASQGTPDRNAGRAAVRCSGPSSGPIVRHCCIWTLCSFQSIGLFICLILSPDLWALWWQKLWFGSSKDLLGPSSVSVGRIDHVRLALDRMCGWQCYHVDFILAFPGAPSTCPGASLLHSGTGTSRRGFDKYLGMWSPLPISQRKKPQGPDKSKLGQC